MPQLLPFNIAFYLITFVVFATVLFYLLNTTLLPSLLIKRLSRLFMVK